MDAALFMRLRAEAERRAAGAGSAHDFSHVTRVVASARAIAAAERANVDVAITAALLHELFNYPKDHPQSHASGDVCADHAGALLVREGAPPLLVAEVPDAIRSHAFSRGLTPRTLEAAILQDADRLDAIGAIGIARCFATCEAMGRPFYAPSDPFCRARPADDKAWGLDHFFKKLLLIPDRLHTETARALARPRLELMRRYLDALGEEIGDQP